MTQIKRTLIFLKGGVHFQCQKRKMFKEKLQKIKEKNSEENANSKKKMENLNQFDRIFTTNSKNCEYNLNNLTKSVW